MKSRISVIILAAGNSDRMGQCKFLLPMANGLTFFENIIQTFSDFGILNIVVVTQAKYLNILQRKCIKNNVKSSFVVNNFPEHERFYSLQLGIKALGDSEFCFVHNADSPFIDRSTLDLLVSKKNEADFVCPVFNNKGGHPILLNKDTLNELLMKPMNSNLKDELIARSRLNVMVDSELVTVDIDTPDDYKKYFN